MIIQLYPPYPLATVAALNLGNIDDISLGNYSVFNYDSSLYTGTSNSISKRQMGVCR